MFNFIRQLIRLLREPPEPNWHVECEAKPSKTHPLGGFWKRRVNYDHGIAIGAADENRYFISFCGPSGCFEKGKYRPNSTIEGDPNYRVVDNNTIEIRGRKGFTRYVRVKSRA